ncbi:SsrA-binding protein SmpB [Gemella sp. GH3]|uniref:SsrA-binding protein SmpB n=1 Tax=unclassified Gemella TaxID=2624949 RepID=UPI0015CF917F|nr:MULTISPECIES: SsrA-binding protein SmpB [unclassified Gemella]MBF0713866.1 SsrA-binding protein SmpB [Gemella sp. GH3.1]NYS50818.1 SsrA-binding protein SmpB [Gemella sp. GH3]
MSEIKVIANNKKAHHDYFVEDTYEAGLVLTGTEIKSIRRGRINLKDSYCQTRRGEVFVYNMHISHFEEGNRFNHEPLRTRKLLLHKKQIKILQEHQNTSGISIIPLKLYIKKGYAKLLIGVAKGKKNYDKRNSLKQKEAKKEINRVLKEKQRY